MNSAPMYATPTFIASVKNEHEVAVRKAEAAQNAYLAEIKDEGERIASGRKIRTRHRKSALRVAYHKASAHAEKLAREVAELTSPNTTLSHAGTSARKQDGATTGVGSSNS